MRFFLIVFNRQETMYNQTIAKHFDNLKYILSAVTNEDTKLIVALDYIRDLDEETKKQLEHSCLPISCSNDNADMLKNVKGAAYCIFLALYIDIATTIFKEQVSLLELDR
jgi:hypothetical protein